MFEVLIAILLLALFSTTFFSSPFKTIKEEMGKLHRIEMSRLTEDSFLEAVQEINGTAWHSLGAEDKAAIHILEPIQFGGNLCSRSYTLFTLSGIRTDKKTGRPYKKGIIKLTLEWKGQKHQSNHHVLVYAKTAHAF